MVTKDKRIDAYIAKAQPFAQPILTFLRSVVHQACPDVVETVKWSSPSFEYHGILCGMAAFKQHCAFGLWKHSLVFEKSLPKEKEAMGSFGRITHCRDLPTKAELIRYIKKGMQLNEQGISAPREKTRPKKALAMPAEFKAALGRNKKAAATFEAFPPSQKREYVEWIATAKGEDTRARRLETSIEWLSEGKRKNWKYERC